MAGIAAFFARESVPDFNVIIRPMIDSYITGPKHDVDCVMYNTNTGHYHAWDQNEVESFGEDRYKEFRTIYQDTFRPESVLLFGIDLKVQQVSFDGTNDKIHSDSIFMLNHSSNKFTIGSQEETAYYLANVYRQHRDMKRTLECQIETDINILALDTKKKFIYSANDGHQGLQMCHAYIKGIGFMLHENMVCLRNIIHDVTACSEDAVNLWETWYGHPLESEVIRETDLISGNMRKIKFNPKYSY